MICFCFSFGFALKFSNVYVPILIVTDTAPPGNLHLRFACWQLPRVISGVAGPLLRYSIQWALSSLGESSVLYKY